MREKEDFYRALVENALDIFVLMDERGTVKYVNDSVLRILGYRPEEITGRNYTEFIHPEELEKAARIFRRALTRTDYSPVVELRVRRSDGTWAVLEGIGRNYLDDPRVHGIVLTLRDVSEKKMEEKLHHFFYEQAGEMIFTYDRNLRIVDINQAACRFIGYSKDELLGESILKVGILHPQEIPRAAEVIRELLEGAELHRHELRLIKKDGTVAWVEMVGAPVRDSGGKVINVTEIVHDVTERKMMEEELKKRVEELETFAHTISHDLQAPLTIIEGYAKAALEAQQEGDTAVETECLQSIMKGVERMGFLIRSLLEYARAAYFDDKHDRVDPFQAVLEALMDLEESIRSRGIDISVQEDLPPVLANQAKMHQVWLNLVGNAVKHLGPKETPHVEVGARREGEWVVFWVKDNGVGIHPRHHTAIFEPFKRFSEESPQGLGIGLSTVKRAVESWGGKVWVESEPGKGASFFFTARAADG
jgi:PAS domain S-box-containing protein